MFDKCRILLFESEFKNNTVNINYLHHINHPTFEIRHRGEQNPYSAYRNFVFSMTRIKEYFTNFSIDMSKLNSENFITPVYDINLIIEFRIDRLEINRTHPDHFGGVFYHGTSISINEATLDDGTVYRKTLYTFRFTTFEDRTIIERLHLKANKQYRFSFLDDIAQRVFNHKNESYDIEIDFSLRFYYTTEDD